MSPSTTGDTIATAAAAEAAQAAFHRSTVESWTLYSIGVAVTVLRTYGRVRDAGFRGLRAEDFLVWVGIVFYSAQTALAYSVGNVAQGLANNGMTDEQRATLSHDDPEYRYRVIGSKIQVAGWTTYSVLMCSLKLSMLCFYIQLTQGLGPRYRLPIHIGFALVIATFVASILTIYTACHPLHNYWQINPDPGNACQAAISEPIVWVCFVTNVSTDIFLILIPIPMLWKSSLKLLRKIAATIIFSAGLFILACAIMKTVFVLVDPVNGAELAGAWGTREAFVAVITTNLPMIFHLVRSWLAPRFGSFFQSSQRNYQLPSALHSGESNRRNHRGPPTVHPITNLTFNESEERMVDDVKLRNLGVDATGGIIISKQVEVTRENRVAPTGRHHEHQVRNIWQPFNP